MGDVDEMPHRVGPYEIVLRLAKVDAAAIYLARSTAASETDPWIALEVVDRPLRATTSDLTRFRHPNVVRVFEVGSGDPGPFVAMEYVPGESLAVLQRLALAAGAELPAAIGLRIVVDALAGLDSMHVPPDGTPSSPHGDVSARHLLVGTDGITRLIGFGRGNETSTARDDVRTAGAIAWALLAGRELSTGDAEAPRLQSVAPAVSSDLDAIVARALGAEPLTATELARDLSRAAEAAGVLASPSEVAANVLRLVGPELSERRARLDEIRRSRLSRPTSAPDVRTLIGMAGPPPRKRTALPALPERPLPIEDVSSDLRIAVSLGAGGERASTRVLGAGGERASDPITRDEQEPEVYRPPLGPPSGMLPDAVEDDAFRLPGSPSPFAALRTWLAPPWTTKKLSILAGSVGGLIGVALVLVAITGTRKESSGLGAASGSAVVASAASLVKTVEPAPADTSTPRAAPAPVESEPSPVLQIKANGAIASVRIGERHVDSVVPAPSVGVDLDESESAQTLKVIVMSTDGRTASANVEPGASEIEVTFSDKPVAHRPRPAPATTVKHPWTKPKRR